MAILSLGISTNLDTVTSQYVDVRIERKKEVLDKYHNTVFPKKQEQGAAVQGKKKKTKSNEMSL